MVTFSCFFSCFQCSHPDGMHALFFFKVPTIVRSKDSKDFANGRVLKKLSIVMFLPDPLYGGTKSLTTLSPTFFSQPALEFPV